MATEADNDARARLRFPSWYNPYTPDAIERRRKLFEDIARNRTSESEDAMDKVYRIFAEEDDLADVE